VWKSNVYATKVNRFMPGDVGGGHKGSVGALTGRGRVKNPPPTMSGPTSIS